MNLRALDTPLMIALAEGWLNDADIRDEVTTHPLGAAAFDHLDDMTRELTRQSRLCDVVAADVARMGQELQALSTCYSRKARAFHNHLDALADAAGDPERAERYRELKQFFFPRGLSVTKRSYMEMSGVIVELEHAVTPEMMARLEDVRVGEYTLAELFRDWAAAGHAIGEVTLERMHLQASISRGHTLAARSGKMHLRNKWIRALRLLMGVMDELPLSQETREQFFAPLAKVLRAQQRRAGSAASNEDADPHALAQASADATSLATAETMREWPAPSNSRIDELATESIDEHGMERMDELLAERMDGSFMRIDAVGSRSSPIIPLLEPYATDSTDDFPSG